MADDPLADLELDALDTWARQSADHAGALAVACGWLIPAFAHLVAVRANNPGEIVASVFDDCRSAIC